MIFGVEFHKLKNFPDFSSISFDNGIWKTNNKFDRISKVKKQSHILNPFLAKNNFRDIFFVFLIIGLIFFAWRGILSLDLRGDSTDYLTDRYNVANWRPHLYFSFEYGAVLVGGFLSKLFSTNIILYFWTELVVMLVISVMFYFMAKGITKRRIVAFFGTIIFSASYFGNFDILSDHCYCFFLERGFWVMLLIPSFLLLHYFLETKKLKYLLISLLLNFLAIGLGRFTVLFTAPFLLYPIFWYLFNRKDIREKIKGIVVGLSYLAVSGFIILMQKIFFPGLGPLKWTFLEFLTHPFLYEYPKRMLLELSYWTQYPSTVGAFDATRYVYDMPRALAMAPYIAIVYVISAIVIYKRLPKQRALLFTTMFATLAIFYLNTYFGQYDVLGQPGSSRYLFLPGIMLAIFWMLFCWSVLINGKRRVILMVVLLGIYYFFNVGLINNHFKWISVWSGSAKAVHNHIISIRPYLKKDTLVVAPYPEIGTWESIFFNEKLGKGEVAFLPDHNIYPDYVMWEKVASKSAHVIRLRYDKKCPCIVEEILK